MTLKHKDSLLDTEIPKLLWGHPAYHYKLDEII